MYGQFCITWQISNCCECLEASGSIPIRAIHLDCDSDTGLSGTEYNSDTRAAYIPGVDRDIRLAESLGQSWGGRRLKLCNTCIQVDRGFTSLAGLSILIELPETAATVSGRLVVATGPRRASVTVTLAAV